MINATLIKIAISLIAGIVLGFYFKFPVPSLVAFGMLLFIAFIFSFFRARKLFFQDIFFGINCALIFLFLGFLSTSLHLPENDPNHYLHQVSKNPSVSGERLIAEVTEKLKPGLFQDKYIVSVKSIQDKKASGKILLNITRTPEVQEFQPGNLLALPFRVSNINTPLNPHQFNYRAYMANLGVYGQLNLNRNEVLKMELSNSGIRSIAGQVRNKIISELRRHEFAPQELAIIQALLLGQRQDISPEIYSNYAAAGVIHILAVSGLHVGIILLLLNHLLKPVERIRYGKPIKAILLIFLLWGFALLAGLSPSVVRAVSMFSFIAIAMQLNRRSSVLNALFTSLIFLLLINPYFIFQVGFQLSYAAVLSIVLIQPHLFGLFTPRYRLVKYMWGILTVTIAAQIGVLPLSLFYFHQFPGLFFVSNLVILPFLGLLLGLGILVMLLAVVGLLPAFLTRVYGEMIELLNEFVSFIASKEDFLFQEIYFSALLLLASYLLVFSFVFLLKKFNYNNIVFLLIATGILQIGFIYEKNSAKTEEGIIFHKSRNSILGEKTEHQLVLHHNLDTSAASQNLIKDFKTGRNIQHIREIPLKNLYQIAGKTIFVIDSSGVFDITGLNPQVVLLINSPRINLDRLLTHLNPEILIADGSNYPSYMSRWQKTGLQKNIPFHATGEKGAFIFYSSEEILTEE
ncbi:ComEC/Rec2 family competence protein [Gillisia limnaea]|uniref:ComEC/Rec2-related protein n=1 Tax=Gillisia limnaea (strain DSM 15749 / LMG 21470 / R-8282) TaxID=865937 RepID=H2BZI1_GILLR|nr:ComEC/Rec2 family competence protein [Gillisia limnaea]EHQ02344.1 ComEC/Rec2-related protein [Gillisia limnaea DSM 15749]